MKIEIGKYAGFCRGVKRAVDLTFACAREIKGPIFTDGPLIHNPQTLKLLEQHDVHTLPDEGDVARFQDRFAVVRAHGTTPERLAHLKKTAKKVKNFTCPDVARVQAMIRKHDKLGYSVVIFGKRSHPEVRGLLGFTRDGHVVFDEGDVDSLPDLNRVLVVSQTTMAEEAFEAICAAIRARFDEVKTINTICDATRFRQQEVRNMAARNDCTLVIGGKDSSNTKRLFEIARSISRAHLISDVDDVRSLDFKGVKKLGVTAGASTPDWLIDEVIDAVKRTSRTGIRRFFEAFMLFGLYSNLFVATGAAFLALAVADIISLPFSFDIALLVSLYYLSMSMLNCYTNRATLKIDQPSRFRFMVRFRFLYGGLFFASMAAVLGIAWVEGAAIFGLTLFSVALAIAYNVSFLPNQGETQRILFLQRRDLQALKSVVISLAVTILLTGLPLLKVYPNLGLLFADSDSVFTRLGLYFSLYYVFLLMFTRQVLFEMKTAQTDRIAGVSSLINLISRRTIIILLIALPSLLLIIMLAGVFWGAYPADKSKYFLALGYNYLLVFAAMNRRFRSSRFAFEFLVESNLFVAGLIALI